MPDAPDPATVAGEVPDDLRAALAAVVSRLDKLLGLIEGGLSEGTEAESVSDTTAEAIEAAADAVKETAEAASEVIEHTTDAAAHTAETVPAATAPAERAVEQPVARATAPVRKPVARAVDRVVPRLPERIHPLFRRPLSRD